MGVQDPGGAMVTVVARGAATISLNRNADMRIRKEDRMPLLGAIMMLVGGLLGIAGWFVMGLNVK